MVECPVCKRYVPRLTRSGACHDCPEYKRILGLAFRSESEVAGGVSQFNRRRGHGALIQKPAGRSGPIQRFSSEYATDRFVDRSKRLQRSRGSRLIVKNPVKPFAQ